jgi:hypothetical protein
VHVREGNGSGVGAAEVRRGVGALDFSGAELGAGARVVGLTVALEPEGSWDSSRSRSPGFVEAEAEEDAAASGEAPPTPADPPVPPPDSESPSAEAVGETAGA